MQLPEWLESELQQDIFKRKYQYQGETLDEFFYRVSGDNEDVMQLIKAKKFIFAGRTLANRNTHKEASYSNCYSSGYAPDSVEGIMDLCKNLALTYKAQGGQGVSLSKIRPKNTGVKNNTFQSDGIIPFMELFNQTTASISQGCARKGALMMSLDCWHNEILEFINVKSKLESITKANLSVEIDNAFMNDVLKYYTKGETVIHTIRRYYEGNPITYEIIPIDVFNAIVERAYDWAEPGIIFVDEFRNYNLMEHIDDYMVITGNPCVTGDTLVMTDIGYQRIDSLTNDKVEVWNGEEFSLVEPYMTGISNEILCIEFSDGSNIKCTPYHKFYINECKTYKKQNIICLEAKNLSEGMKLEKFNYPVVQGKINLPEKEAYTKGVYAGDDSFAINKDRHDVYLYGKKKELLKYLDYKTYYICDSDRFAVILNNNVKFDKIFVPLYDYTVETRLNWLSGLIDTDGSVDVNGTITIWSVNYDFLNNVKLMLHTLGSRCVLLLGKDAELKAMPNGKGGTKNYHCQTSYRITISGFNVMNLVSLGLTTHRVDTSHIVNRNAERFITVKSIKQIKGDHPTYCFNEPKRHKAMFGCVLTGQCGEQPLPKDGACSLASMNLSEYVLDPYSEYPKFDFVNFINDVKTSIIAMDEVLDEGFEFHALQTQIDMAKNYRNIGLGIMGIGEMLIKLNITYGSNDAITLLDKITREMFRTAVLTSNKLAYDKGTFPKYTSEVFDSEIILNHFSLDEIEELKDYGLRNCSLLSIAPTGSIGTMFNISGGIEPVFAIKYTRKTESLHKDKNQYYDVYCKAAEEYMKLYPDVSLPQWFVDAEDIPWSNRIDMQATVQKHIDTAISSTINLPKDTHKPDVAWLFIHAWEKKLKGCTVYRSGCKREAILKSCNNENINEDEVTKNSFILPRGFIEEVPKELTYRKYKLRTGCGNLYFFVGVDEYENKIYDCFTNTDGQGGCTINTIANSRLLSAGLRGGVPIEYLTQQLEKSGSCPAYQNVRGRQIGALKIKNMLPKDTDENTLSQIDEYVGKPLSNGKSCASALSYILKNICKEFENEEYEFIPYNKATKNEILNNEHTECQHPNLKMVQGCSVCPDCGYSKCQ